MSGFTKSRTGAGGRRGQSDQERGTPPAQPRPLCGEVSGRDLVKIALSVTAAGGAIDVASAQHVHEVAAADKTVNGGVYKPRLFNEHEYMTLRKLAELIVPADDVSPSALESGACEFIDLLSSNNDELAAKYTGGIAWLDREMLRRYRENSAEMNCLTPGRPESVIQTLRASSTSMRNRKKGQHFCS